MKIILSGFKGGLDLYAVDPKPPANDAGLPGELELPRSWIKLHLEPGSVNELTDDEAAQVKKQATADRGLILSHAGGDNYVLTSNVARDGRTLLKSTFADDSRSIIERAINSRITVSLN